MIAPKRIIGFSTVNSNANTPNGTLYDQELALRDLLNAFYTPKGSRVMLPNFGSNIHYYVFENLTPALKDEISNDVQSVVQSDPRFELQSHSIEEQDYGVTVSMVLLYNPTGMNVPLSVDFKNKIGDNL